jgi:hypothetical protein
MRRPWEKLQKKILPLMNADLRGLNKEGLAAVSRVLQDSGERLAWPGLRGHAACS